MTQTLFIDTNTLPRQTSPQGAFTEIVNNQLAGAKNVVGTLRWLKSGETFRTDAADRHQLLYVMEGQASIDLENKRHDVTQGMGVYLGPAENAAIQAAPGSHVKLFHLAVPQIPQ